MKKFSLPPLVLPALLLIALFCSCAPLASYLKSEDVLHWEADISVIDSLNNAEYSDENTLLVTGSSSIRLWDSIHTDLAPFQIMQRGYGGAKLTDFNYYAERIIKPHRFKAILVFVANDITGGEFDKTPREVFALYKMLVEQIRERNQGTPVVWIEVTPTPSRWVATKMVQESSELIRNYCDQHQDCFFLPTFDVFINASGVPDPGFFRKDMLHLNRKGYELWTETILNALKMEGIQ